MEAMSTEQCVAELASIIEALNAQLSETRGDMARVYAEVAQLRAGDAGMRTMRAGSLGRRKQEAGRIRCDISYPDWADDVETITEAREIEYALGGGTQGVADPGAKMQCCAPEPSKRQCSCTPSSC